MPARGDLSLSRKAATFGPHGPPCPVLGDIFGERLPEAARRLRETARTDTHDMITKLGTGAGIERRVRPHGIRHTAITKASRLMKTANLGLPALQAFSNHRSPATLGRYIDPDNEAAYSLAELVSETSSFK